MEEKWKNIDEFPGYQVSNTGKVRSFWHKQKRIGTWGGVDRVLSNTPYEVPQSDDGNGYAKVFLQNDTKRRCVKVHRLVAETFIVRPSEDMDTVDHIVPGPIGKRDNSINNLRWISRRDNIKKAYNDGVCDERIQSQYKCILVIDEWDNQEIYFESTNEAAIWLHVDYTTISHAIKNDSLIHKRFRVSHLDGESKILYDGGYFDATHYNY